MTPETLTAWERLGIIGLLFFVIFALWRGWWVLGSTLKATIERYEKGLADREATIKVREATIDDLRTEIKDGIAERAMTAEREREALERLVTQAQRERETQQRQIDMLLSLVPRGESSSPGPSFPPPSIRELDQ